MHVFMIRNHSEDKQGLGKGQGVKEKLGRLQQEEAKSNSTCSPPQSSGPVCTQNDASEVHLGHVLYGWKAKEISFPT
jgi:hypothetical protein